MGPRAGVVGGRVWCSAARSASSNALPRTHAPGVAGAFSATARAGGRGGGCGGRGTAFVGAVRALMSGDEEYTADVGALFAAEFEEELELEVEAPNSENAADDIRLMNPKLRQERFGLGWFGVIFEYEGVLVEDRSKEHDMAWVKLMEEEGKERPINWDLKKASGLKAEEAISNVFCLTRNPMEVRRLAARRLELYLDELKGNEPKELAGAKSLVHALHAAEIPIAVGTAEPEEVVLAGLKDMGLHELFDAVVTSEDVPCGNPEPQMYLHTASLLQRIPARCIVVGNSNLSIEAAHNANMKAVVTTSRHPVYELSSADAIVSNLDELCIMDLKAMFREEELREASSPEEVQEALNPGGGWDGEEEEEEDWSRYEMSKSTFWNMD